MPSVIQEDHIEKAAIQLLVETLGYRTINCFTDNNNDLNDKSNRISKNEVVFHDILKQQTIKLNPTIPKAAIEEALTQLTAPRSAMSPVLANREIDQLIKNGIRVQYENSAGKTEKDYVKVIDFTDPQANDFLAVTQLWIKGDPYYRRPDIILYINGLPLVFIELKNSNVKVRNAYDDNLTNYKKDIPRLFLYNAFCVLSNAVHTRVGSFTAGYEHFFNWLRVDDEKEKLDTRKIEKEATSLEYILKGLCTKERLLDYLEHFIFYYDYEGVSKIVAQNHQFLGVNKAVASFRDRKNKKGKLGVFWHTQGSGKSFSMIFLYRKINRLFTGNFTFVIVTDRLDLDGQIYKNFIRTDTIKKDKKL